ncbi:uncharacterized protein PG986_004275 [Apiospora aurea]|uniref:Rhodopsin domain-containing protein n=1 Tax=Apiospora aurea TaxID=335848 RepID=A0ABR1QM51_9PEZI
MYGCDADMGGGGSKPGESELSPLWILSVVSTFTGNDRRAVLGRQTGNHRLHQRDGSMSLEDKNGPFHADPTKHPTPTMSAPEGVDLCAVPVGTAPDGTFDLVHGDSLETASITVCVLLTVLALFFAGPRIYVNRRQLLIADYFTILAVVFSIAYCILIAIASRYYRHDWNLPACWFDAGFVKFCLVFFSGFVQFFPRAAIFLLYRQLFQVHNSRVRIPIWIGLVFTFLTNFPNIPISLAVEAPHPGETWEQVLVRLSAPATGHDFRLWGPIQGAASVALDIFAFVLPLPIIARLNLTKRKKMQILLLFSTAFLAIVASIVALVYKVELLIIENRNEGDQNFLLGPVNICIDAEANIAIVVGSMPAFSNFMKLHVLESRAFQTLRSTLGVGSSSEKGSGERGPVRPLHGTIGSPAGPKRKPAYHELTDSNILNSRYTVDVENNSEAQAVQPGHILRTMDVRQESRE